MTVKLKISISISMLIIAFGFSQDLPLLTNTNIYLIHEVDQGEKRILGSPYIVETFLPAKVSGDINKIFKARYNAIIDEIEVETEGGTIQAINKNIPGIVVIFLNDNKTYKGITYFNNDNNAVNGYLIPITNENDKVKLYLKEKKVFIDRKPAKTGYEVSQQAKFDRVDDSYYIVINNEIAKPLSKNKKEIASLFQNHEKEILKYISSERLNVKKKEDLIKLFAFINKL